MSNKNRVFFILISIFSLMLSGCASNTPSGEKKIRSQEKAAQQAQQEMQESLQSDKKLNQQNIDSHKNATPSFDQTTQGLPSWVTSPPSSHKYVYGVGSAKTYTNPAAAMNRAKDQARTEILKQMEVTVSGKTQTSVSRHVKDGKSQVTRSLMDQVRTRVSETKLSHIQHVGTHVDKKEDTVYALLRLDRDAAKADLLSQLEKIDSRLRAIASRETEGTRLKQLKTLMPALPLLEKRRQILEKLNKFSQKAPDHRLPAELRDLQNRIASLLDSLVVVLRPQNQKSEKLTSGLRKALSKQGLRIRQSGQGDVLLRYDVSLRNMERDGVQFVFAQGYITVLNRKGDILNEFQEKAKAASQNPGLARDRAITNLAEVLGQKLAESLIKSFELQFAGSL